MVVGMVTVNHRAAPSTMSRQGLVVRSELRGGKLPAMSWTIEIQDPERGTQSRHDFNEPTVIIGRDPSADLVVRDEKVSRRHLKLMRRDGQGFIEDQSSNGTYVAVNRRWERLPARHQMGDPVIVRLGRFNLRIQFSPTVRDEPQEWDKSVVIPAGNLSTLKEALLVFDLCESSAIANRDDHMAYHLKQRLTQIAEPVLEDEDRRFFKSTGDGFLACFPKPSLALNAALELERRIQHRNARTENPPIHYRMALHFGETWLIAAGGDDIHGNDVNITFRIEGVKDSDLLSPETALPARDRILCSTDFIAAYGEIEDSPVPIEHISCGRARLKGISAPVGIELLQTDFAEATATAEEN